MIYRNHHIVVGSYKELYTLIPVGDLQLGAAGVRKDRLADLTARIQKLGRRCLTIGMADYSDIFRPSVEAKMTGALGADPDAQEQYDQLHKAQMRGIAKQVESIFIPGQCLGLLSGHHAERVYADGITGTQYLCQLLNVPYLGTMAMIRIRFLLGDRKKNHGTAHSLPVIVHAHHGHGSTQTIGADLNKIESKIAPHWEADIYLRGHSTKVGGVHLPPRTHMSETDPPMGIQRDRVMLNTGGYLDGYAEGVSGYVQKAAMVPAHLGWGEVLIHIHTERHGSHCFNKFSLTVTS